VKPTRKVGFLFSKPAGLAGSRDNTGGNMKKLRWFAAVLVVLMLTLSLVPWSMVSAQTTTPAPVISLSPVEGFSSITVSGSDFPNLGDYGPYTVHVLWDGIEVPTYPVLDDLVSEGNLDFVVIISVPTQASPGLHTVSAYLSCYVYNEGVVVNTATAIADFTVIDMTGPTGPAGPMGASGMGVKGDKGDTGAQGVQGPAGSAGAQGPAGPQGPPGPVVTVTVEPEGTVASAPVTGPQGPQGPQGPAGEPGAITGISIAALGVALVAFILILIGFLKKIVVG
jgi:hypothetical protein